MYFSLHRSSKKEEEKKENGTIMRAWGQNEGQTKQKDKKGREGGGEIGREKAKLPNT